MISLQSHNQVLYHLAQVTSAINTRSSPFTIKGKQRNESLSPKSVDELCQESFSEAVKNCTELPRVRFNSHNLYNKLHSKKNNVWIILDNVSIKYTKECSQSNTRWKQSYVSSWSFMENKRDFPCSQVTKPVILPAIYVSSTEYKSSPNWCSRIPSTHNVQVRGFKTKRNINAELERNLPFSDRVKQWFGQANVLESDSKSKFTPDVKESKAERLKEMFNNSDIPLEEQKRIKTAFAEGYEAALHRSNRVRPLWWKTVLNFTLLAVFIIGITVLVSTTSGIFKFAFGDRVQINPEEMHVTFNDVKGVDQAKQELKDVVEFLKNPEKFSALGGKLPKGVLLVGPPGTGKTLLARAVAGEAAVPFFQAAGPEFDEILVGQGARRVRELFKSAKEKAPCVVFIDEIDSVGSKRTNSVLHPYANQTINQLLSEMDGFHQNEGVIVLGATNRRDDLDKALLRPGRFDVEIYVQPPDYFGRKEIIELYLSRILTRDTDVDLLARCTTGFTGADIENLINQAALKAAIDGADYVTMEHLEQARDKVIMGPEGRLKSHDEELLRITAYHEGGHALVSHYTQDAMPLHKVTIMPRGPSLGHTSYLPAKDMYLTTKTQLLAQMDTMMGGRAAEELIFGMDRVTTGASRDFEAATRIAERMVKLYGMSEKVGFRWHTDANPPYQSDEYSPNTKDLIDSEIKRLLQESYERAKAILRTHSKEHTLLAEALLKYETLDAEDVKAIVNGKKPRTEILTNKSVPIIDVAPKNVL